MTRLDYGATVPGARHRFAEAGSRMAIDSAPVFIQASGDEPVTLDLSHTSLLQVLAAELRESGLLMDFIRVAMKPHDLRTITETIPRLRLHPRVISALTLTWSTGMALDVSAALTEAVDVAEDEGSETHQFAAGVVDLTDDAAEVAK